MVLKSELNAGNKLKAINTLEVPVVTYSFNIMNWTLQELAKLDTKTRKFLTMYKMHHSKSEVDRLYLPRTEGGREFVQLELSYKMTTIGFEKYLQETEATFLHFVKDRDDRKSLYSISRQSMKFSRELGVPAIPPAEDEANTTYARRIKVKAKHQGRQQLRSNWEAKALHGKYAQWVKQADVDHNKAAAHMHWKICKEFGIEVKERCYEHQPKTVTEKDSVTILWDMPIHTERTIAANRPDIVLKNNQRPL